jgi:hypothetical protein
MKGDVVEAGSFGKGSQHLRWRLSAGGRKNAR